MLFFDGWRDMYPVRRELGVVRLLEAEADVEGVAGVPTLWRDVGKGDNFGLDPLNNVGLEVTALSRCTSQELARLRLRPTSM